MTKLIDIQSGFQNLYDFMLSKNLPCPKDIILDGTIKRYCKDNSKKADEWYLGSFVNASHYWCIFGSWTTGEKFKFRSWKEKEVSDLDFKTYRKQLEQAEEQRKKDIEKTISELKEKYSSLPDTNSHPYLERKQVDYSFKHWKNNIVIPLYNSKQELQTCQMINENGDKRFYPGLPFSGGRFVFGVLNKKEEALICEGMATGFSLHTATKKAVVAAFSSSNIAPVAKQLKEDGYKLIHAQDLGEAGDRVAEELKKLEIRSVKPKQKEDNPLLNDFNDLATEEGYEAVSACFKKPLASIPLAKILTSDLPPIKWLIEDFITEGSVNLVWAPPGLGKSTFCYAMAFHAAAGKPFLFKKIPNKLKTLYIDGEMTQVEIKEKTNMIHLAMNLDDKEQPDENSIHVLNYELWEKQYSDIIDLYCPTTREIINQHIDSLKPQLIFLDNFSSLTGLGNSDGYSNKEEAWKQIHHWIKSIISHGTSVIIVHHSNKEGSLYGTSAIQRSVSTEIELKETKANTEFELMFELHMKKARHLKGIAKSPKLVHFDNDEKGLIQQPRTNPEQFWKTNSHWISVPIKPKEK